MILQVKTVKARRRFLCVRLRFSLSNVCFLLVILTTALIWIVKWCELEKLEKIKQAKGSCWPELNVTALKLLEDVLEAEFKPRPDRSIFFHETSCTKNGTVILNAR